MIDIRIPESMYTYFHIYIYAFAVLVQFAVS